MIGRGTDISLDSKAKVHGLNVMVTYLPRVRDLEQIIGRSGRFGAEGETSLVLNKKRLEREIGKPLGSEYYRNVEGHDGRAVTYKNWYTSWIATLKGYANLLPFVHFADARRPFANLRAGLNGTGQMFPNLRAFFANTFDRYFGNNARLPEPDQEPPKLSEDTDCTTTSYNLIATLGVAHMAHKASEEDEDKHVDGAGKEDKLGSVHDHGAADVHIAELQRPQSKSL